MTFLKILLIAASAIAALVIETALIIRDGISAAWDVCIVGNEKAAVRRRFK